MEHCFIVSHSHSVTVWLPQLHSNSSRKEICLMVVLVLYVVCTFAGADSSSMVVCWLVLQDTPAWLPCSVVTGCTNFYIVLNSRLIVHSIHPGFELTCPPCEGGRLNSWFIVRSIHPKSELTCPPCKDSSAGPAAHVPQYVAGRSVKGDALGRRVV